MREDQNQETRGSSRWQDWFSVDVVHSIITLVLIAVVVSQMIYIGRITHSIDAVQQVEQQMESHLSVDSIYLATFDPNTATLAQLKGLGLSNLEALSIIRYREFVRPFRIKEELINCYNISDSLYFSLEPYITIGEEFRYKRPDYSESNKTERATYTERVRPTPLAPSKFLVDTVSAEYLKAIGALSIRQAEVFVNWREMSGIHTEEELRECYVISDSIATWLMRYAIFTPRQPRVVEAPQLVDLNRADSATLRSVRGIGEKSVVAILDYRKKLGGFYSAEQLTEIDVISESNFEKIIEQIFVDSCDISKIDINFAVAKVVKEHPYISARLRRLLKIRELKGGWSQIEEMIEDNIFTHEEAERVRPYLLFSAD